MTYRLVGCEGGNSADSYRKSYSLGEGKSATANQTI